MPAEFIDEERKQKIRLNERFNRIGWGLFLIMLGVIWLLPDNILPDGILAIGIGIILIGLSFIKRTYRNTGYRFQFISGNRSTCHRAG